jgi:hypothetical protein
LEWSFGPKALNDRDLSFTPRPCLHMLIFDNQQLPQRMNQNPSAKPIVWWVLWVSFMAGVFAMYYILGSKPREVESGVSGSVWLIGVLPAVVATGLRWAALPRMPAASAALPLFVGGIALCEASLFLGLFIFPEHKQTLFIVSLVGMLQFAPYFAHQYRE